ncbi:MAG: PH domain-containing protein [Balneolaceae bacterium]
MSEFKRQHPVAAISRLIDLIRQNLVTIIILLFISTTRSNGYFWYFLIGGILIALVAGVFGWWMFKYRVHKDELQISKGIFVKNKLYLSKDRIQVIDVTEGILQRVFGLVQVEIKTAGSGTETATISAITREEAEELRNELRKKTAGDDQEEVVAGMEPEVREEEVEAFWELSNKDLVLAAFTSGNFGLIASILGAISGQLDQFINEETIEYIYEMAPGYSNVTVIISLILVIFILSWLLSFTGVILKYSHFKLEKTAKELVISSGLLERKHITIPFDRIQAVRFVEGIIRQPFGFGILYVESAGFDQSQKERSIVLVPFLSSDKVSGFLKQFLSEFNEPEYHIKPPLKSLFRYLRKPNYLLLIAIPVSWYLWDFGWAVALLIPVFAFIGWMQYKDAALALGDHILRMRYRVLSRTTALVKKNRVQNVELDANPFQRRKQIQSLRVVAASGAGGIGFEIPDLTEEDCFTAYQWVVGENEDPVILEE